jgi:hypothetical protein
MFHRVIANMSRTVVPYVTHIHEAVRQLLQ